MTKISIVNYGSGNIGSIYNMIKRAGVEAEIVHTPQEIYAAERLILPGVGAFDTVMSKLNSVSGLVDCLNFKVLQESTPILGLCVGMQVMLTSSEEGHQLGLNWIPGSLTKFPESAKVPHVGWNTAISTQKSQMTESIDTSRFYFVHSYFANLENQSEILFTSNYAGTQFSSGLLKRKIVGVQFHPERSHRYGLQLFQNFARM